MNEPAPGLTPPNRLPPRRYARAGRGAASPPGIGAILAVDVLALLIVLASAPAAWLWLDSWHPAALPSVSVSPVAVASPSASPAPAASLPAGGSGAAPAPTPTFAYGSGSWTTAEALSKPEWGTGSTLLHDGRVLVAGGALGSSSRLATRAVEIFDPSSGHWSQATNMLTARAYPMVIPLADGSVLAAGGSLNVIPLDSAERYYPDSGTWVAVGRMKVPRTQGSLTLLGDGRVLAAGGGIVGAPGWLATASAEIFDPATNAWSLAAPMAVPRAHQTATVLPDGEVLVAGGATTYNGTAGTVTASAEIYNPRTNTWRRASSMSAARYWDAAASLPGGRVLVAGGWSLTTNTDPSLASAEIYDPAADTWARTGSLHDARASLSIATLPDGRLVAFGGVDPAYHMLATAEIYEPGPGTWQRTGSLPAAVQWPAYAVLGDGRVLVAGGSLDTAASRLTAACAIFAPPPPAG